MNKKDLKVKSFAKKERNFYTLFGIGGFTLSKGSQEKNIF
jgi:hypothetical protein